MRKPGDPSPWIGRSTYIRYMMIALECNDAQIGWILAGKPKLSLGAGSRGLAAL